MHVVRSAKVYLVDCPRSRLNFHLPCDLLEGAKNGDVLSSKCVPQKKCLQTPNTLVIFTKEVPDRTQKKCPRIGSSCGLQESRLVPCSPSPLERRRHNHRGKWEMPPADGDDDGKTICRINDASGKETRKWKREHLPDEHREIQLALPTTLTCACVKVVNANAAKFKSGQTAGTKS